MGNWIKNNFWNFFFGIFASVGTILGVVGYSFWKSSETIVKNGIQTTGTVISMNRNSGGSSAPVVEFIGPNDQPIIYYSSMYSSPPSFYLDEKVTLWYLPDDPQKVQLDGLDRWLLPCIFGGFFVIFGGIGYGGLFFQYRKKKREEWLEWSGQSIQADFAGVEYKSNIKLNGRSPWIIVCQYHDKMTGTVHVFESGYIWYQPEQFIQPGRKIKVKVEPGNYKNYKVDISFLPETG